MIVTAFKILSSKRVWKCEIGRHWAPGPSYYIRDKSDSFWNPVEPRDVPRTIERKARCFLADPQRIGVRRSI